MSETASTTRTRTLEWSDPVATAAAGAELAGIDYMRALIAGELPAPPIAITMNMGPIELEEGRVVFAGVPGEEHYNPIGVVHGGYAATILDSVLGCAVHTTLPVGGMYTTLELKVNFLRPSFAGGARLLAEGTVLHRGSTAVLVEATITDAGSGKKIAHATSTCLVLTSRG
jgi:uncharacterized protein (TIGR00369 family)